MIAIRKQPGDPQNAIMAALSVADLKHVVIVDDEIDVYDAMEVEWAMATRVQADRDITILSDARSKPLDPSLPLSEGIPHHRQVRHRRHRPRRRSQGAVPAHHLSSRG